MTEEFTASNGIRIWIDECVDGDYLRGDAYENGPLHASGSPEAIVALREFFLSERDKELKPWRDAQLGEVWEIEHKHAGKVVAIVSSTDFKNRLRGAPRFLFYSPKYLENDSFAIDNVAIITARRIYPEN